MNLFESWKRRGKPKGEIIRTTYVPNAHNIGPIMDLELIEVLPNGDARMALRGKEGVLHSGEWEFIRHEKRSAS